jgi:hypothetical protein
MNRRRKIRKIEAVAYRPEQIATMLDTNYEVALKIVRNNITHIKVGREYRVLFKDWEEA